MTKKATSKVNIELEKALAEELKSVTTKDHEGNYKFSIVERMRVYDRALKLESIKLKIESPEWGEEFK